MEISSFEVDQAYFCIYNIGSMDMRVSIKTRKDLVAFVYLMKYDGKGKDHQILKRSGNDQNISVPFFYVPLVG